MHFWKLEQEYLVQLNDIACHNDITYKAKLYKHKISIKGSQVVDSLASTFEGLRHREKDMLNSKK